MFERTPIEPDKLVRFDWNQRHIGKDRQLECAIESFRDLRAGQAS
jgi:hypothetical protein